MHFGATQWTGDETNRTLYGTVLFQYIGLCYALHKQSLLVSLTFGEKAFVSPAQLLTWFCFSQVGHPVPWRILNTETSFHMGHFQFCLTPRNVFKTCHIILRWKIKTFIINSYHGVPFKICHLFYGQLFDKQYSIYGIQYIWYMVYLRQTRAAGKVFKFMTGQFC